jgi:hypothetical protein
MSAVKIAVGLGGEMKLDRKDFFVRVTNQLLPTVDSLACGPFNSDFGRSVGVMKQTQHARLTVCLVFGSWNV